MFPPGITLQEKEILREENHQIMPFEEQLKGDREVRTVELGRKVDFCLVQVDRIDQHKERNFREKKHAEGLL